MIKMNMKHYLVCDDNDSDNNKLMSYEEMLVLLCNEVEVDTINCYENDNLEGVKHNVSLLKSLAQEHFQTDKVIKELEPYGWYVMDLTQLQRDLSNYQAYKHGVGAPSYPNDCIEQTLKMIEEDMK